MSARMSAKIGYFSKNRLMVTKTRIILLQNLLRTVFPAELKTIYKIIRTSTQMVSERLP